jgi:hypothetical protein
MSNTRMACDECDKDHFQGGISTSYSICAMQSIDPSSPRHVLWLLTLSFCADQTGQGIKPSRVQVKEVDRMQDHLRYLGS